MNRAGERAVLPGFEFSGNAAQSLAVLGLSVGFGFLLCAIDFTPHTAALAVLGLAGLAVLLAYPELALALYVVIGDVKGDERVAGLLPWDLTLVLGGILVAGILLNFLRKKPAAALPGSYFLLLALVVMMTASLSYTPVFEAGLEKLGRFLTVTGIVIVAPFFVLGSAEAMKRFLAGFSVAALVICAYSLTSLGGEDRLVTPSSNTIGLGHIACGLILIIWFGVLPRWGFWKRMMLYPVLAVPVVALIGSGSRGAAMALGFVLLVSVAFHRELLLDLGCMSAIGIALVPSVNIPRASFEYLGTLVNCQSVKALLFFRAELLAYGWDLLQKHPLLGVGIQGFRYYSPNAGLYNWPHNIFLEVSCEMGLAAGLLVVALFVIAAREAWRQVNDHDAPYVTLSQIAAALLVVGMVNATNTGDINSDRSTWLFLSLVYVVREIRRNAPVANVLYLRAVRGAEA
ncbi:MAG TPA: O-antigen ligase family protein [Candidatus Acidoferrales bacterium]